MLIVELLNRLLWNSKNVCLKLIKYMIIKDNFLRLYKDHLIFFNYYFLIHSICGKNVWKGGERIQNTREYSLK